MISGELKNLLFIAYYFPPLGMGGVQRATKFARYLPEYGWQPYVITVKDILYYAKDVSLLDEVSHLTIIRTGSLDPARLIKLFPFPAGQAKREGGAGDRISGLSAFSRHFFYPDSKILWRPFARQKIRSLQRRIQFHAVFSTAPPISSHLIAAKTGLPWVADFRDYWTIGDGIFAPTAWHRKKYRQIMQIITKRAAKITAVSLPIADSIKEIAKETDRNKIVVLPNGFDTNDFKHVAPRRFGKFTIVYSGNLNSKRMPVNFFRALELIFTERPALQDKIQCIFIGKHFELNLPPLSNSLQTVVKYLDYVPHAESLSYILNANLLLLLLSSSSAPGVLTGKVFEYLGTGKPIFAIIPRHVAAYRLLKDKPNCFIADPDDVQSIKKTLLKILALFLQKPGKISYGGHIPEWLQKYTRQFQTQQLAELLDASLTG